MRLRASALGDAQLIDQELQRLAAAADDDVVEEALRAGGDIVVDSIRARISASARQSSGGLSRSIKYRLNKSWLTGRAYSVTFGWDKLAVRRSKKGRTTYASDYGPVLEFSANRQLRHLEQGFEDAQADAEVAMKQTIEKAMNKGG